jgi:hypothetical protein
MPSIKDLIELMGASWPVALGLLLKEIVVPGRLVNFVLAP